MNLCVVATRPRSSTETFIRTHMERLPFDVRVLYGSPPHTDERSGFVLSRPLYERLWYKVADRIVSRCEEQERSLLTARWLKRTGIDVVLAEYGMTGVAIADACARAAVPLVVHFHGHDAYSRPLLEEFATGYRRVFAQAAALVAVSHEMVDQLLAIGAPREKVFYVSYFVDDEHFRGAVPSNAKPHFVGIGRFVETKAPQLTLAAFAEVHRRFPQARLTIAGEGPLRAPCLDLAEYLGVVEAVQFPGNVDHNRVADLLRSARAFVQHSVRCRDNTCEGTPNAVLEAQASGLPVVATRHAGIPDAVLHEETGLLVEERDVSGMADAMVRLVEDPQWAVTLGNRGRERVLDRFSRANTIDRLALLLQQVAERTTVQLPLINRKPGADAVEAVR